VPHLQTGQKHGKKGLNHVSAAVPKYLKKICAAQLRGEQCFTVQSPLTAAKIRLRKGPASATFLLLC
jgi:hypothetical protein